MAANITTEYPALKNGAIAKGNKAFVTGGQVYESCLQKGDVDWTDVYQPIAYLESTGTQWIDTKLTPTSTMGIKIKYRYTTAGAAAVAGIATLSKNPRTDALLVSTGNGQTGVAIFAAHNGGTVLTDITTALDTDYEVEVNYNGSGKIVVNGVEQGDIGSGSVTTAKTIPLFTRYDTTGRAYTTPNSRIYSVTFTDGQNTIMNLEPCYRRSDGVLGMYDTVSKTFFENAGTGVFSADLTPTVLPENAVNKVTSLSAQSTDTQYPSAKCVYDLIAGVDALLGSGVIE